LTYKCLVSADEKKARAKANAPIFAVKLADTQLLENTHARFMIEIKANPLPKLRLSVNLIVILLCHNILGP